MNRRKGKSFSLYTLYFDSFKPEYLTPSLLFLLLDLILDSQYNNGFTRVYENNT